MMKSYLAATMSAAVTMAQKEECDLMCMMIYSFDPETCACVPIEWMECHPQYNNNCSQLDYDYSKGRDYSANPYKKEEWYPGVCDIVCAAIYSVDLENCACVAIPGMECHPQYNG